MNGAIHPSSDSLKAYALGRVSARESIEIESHVAHCSTCAEQLQTVDDDAIVTLVRQTLTAAPMDRLITRSEYGDLRPIARGGLGFIALARDQVFGRDVAIKRILPEGADDLSRRKRFLREAAITGRLEHPGIAPVYGIGEDEAGRPCYAMRYVPGVTLLDSLKLLHAQGPVTVSSLRPLLNRFVSLCNTVAYAHSRGVIHRDIKPANIAIGEYGETILLDWGLAQADDSETAETSFSPDESRSPYDQFQTKTGAVLGTPGYMAPEQAAGARVGPAADVYSLGATLITLLTGHPPCETATRENEPAALRAVADRAMSLQPIDRYASAGDLAREIEGWMNDEPVTAYQEPAKDRLRRFLRRHYTAATVVVALLFVTTVGLAIGTVLLNREQDKTHLALLEKSKAVVAEAHQRQKAEEAQAQTLEDFRAATDDAIVNLIGVKPSLGPDERAYIENALKRWQKLTARQGDDEQNMAIRAESHLRIATLWLKLGRSAESQLEYATAARAYEELTAAFPHDSRYQLARVAALGDYGSSLRHLGKSREALLQYRTSLEILHSLVSAHPNQPSYLIGMGLTLIKLSNLHDTLGQEVDVLKTCEQAKDVLLRAVSIQPDSIKIREPLLGARNNLASRLNAGGKFDRAAQEIESARKLALQLIAEYPNTLDYQLELSQISNTQGLILINLNQREQALRTFQSAKESLLALKVKYPSNLILAQFLAVSHKNLGLMLADLNRKEEAVIEITTARDLLQELVAQSPQVVDYRTKLADVHHNLGNVLKSMGKQEAARKEFILTIKSLEETIRLYPDDMPSRTLLGGVLCDCGQLDKSEKKWADSLIQFNKAKDVLTPILEENAHHTTARMNLRRSCEGQAQSLEAINRFDESITAWDKALALSEKPRHEQTSLMKAKTLFKAGQFDQAIKESDVLRSSDNRDASFWYFLACFYSVASSKVPAQQAELQQHAIASLRKSIQCGYRDPQRLEHETELASIRNHTAFRQLVAELKAKYNLPVK